MAEPPSVAALKEAHDAALTQADSVRSIKASLKEGKVGKVRERSSSILGCASPDEVSRLLLHRITVSFVGIR